MPRLNNDQVSTGFGLPAGRPLPGDRRAMGWGPSLLPDRASSPSWPAWGSAFFPSSGWWMRPSEAERGRVAAGHEGPGLGKSLPGHGGFDGLCPPPLPAGVYPLHRPFCGVHAEGGETAEAGPWSSREGSWPPWEPTRSLSYGCKPSFPAVLSVFEEEKLDFFQSVLMGFQVALSPGNLFFCFVGVLIGTLVGVLPGLGPVAAISLLLPTTFHITPVSAIIMLAGIYYGAMYGGSTTSILVNIPGRGGLRRHLPGRLPDGPPGAGRPGPGHRRLRLLHRRDLGRHRPHARRPSPGRNGPEVRPAGIFFPDDRRA